MPTAIITGASRGLGLALARALAARGWRARRSTPAAPSALERAARELCRAADVVAVAGDVADAAHRRALVERRGRELDLLVNNASVLGPSPQPALADYPLDVLERVYARQRRSRRSRSSSSRSRCCRAGGRDRQHHLRRRRRALRGLGRLRLVEGRARAADARSSRAEHPDAARLRRRPRRHAHADAPGGVPRRGHLRPAAARGERARPARADRRRAPERPLPRPRRSSAGRPRDGARRRSRCPPALRGPRAARGARRSRATTCGCWSPSAPTARSSTRRFRDLPRRPRAPGDLLVVNTSATLPAALPATAAGRRARVELRLSTAAPDLELHGRWWLVELRRADGSAPVARRRGRGRAARAARRRRGGAPRAVRRRRAAVARALALPAEPAARLPRRATGAPIRYGYVPRGVAARRPTRPSSRPSRAAPRCRAPGRPFTPELVTRLVAGGRARRAARAAHRRLLARARRAALPRALPRARGDRAARQRRPRLGRARDRRRHDRRARARDRRRADGDGRGRRGLDRARRHARARAARRRRPAHRLARAARRRTC